jgi:hypothetical protein
MANLVPKSFYLGNTTGSNVYTVANTAGNYSIIKSINICNTSNTDNATADVHILIAGATAAANNKIISNAVVIKNDVLYYNTSIVIPANSNVYVASSNSALTFNISGVEYA